MMNGKKSFILYCDIGEQLDLLPVDECGRLFRAIVAYVNTGQIAQLSPAGQMAFTFIRAQIDRESEKWEAVREKRREAGQKGGLAKVANAKGAKQAIASVAVPVPAPVPVPDSVPVKDIGATAPTRKRFIPPTEKEACDFFKNNGSTAAEGSKFFDFYSSKGWKVGTAAMKNWESAARNWMRRNNQYQLPQPTTGDYDVLELLRGDC